MGKLFEIDSDSLQAAQDGFDDILDSLGKQCKLVYPSKFIECVNCIYDPIGKKSSNRWRTGGPMPFHAGACSMCQGAGKSATENSENVIMTINWLPGKNISTGPNIRVAIGYPIETRGYMTDLAKVRSCEEMIILGGNADIYSHYKFKLDGEPTDVFQAISGRYFVATWKRVG